VSVAEHQLGAGAVVAATGPAVVYAVEGDVSVVVGSDRVLLRPGDAVAGADLVVAGSGRALVVGVPAVVAAQVAAERCFRADARNHYSWGDGCDGWRLVEHPALSVRQERMPPGTTETTHVHIEAHQVFYVLTGRPVMALPDREYPLAPGASIAVPPRVPHQMRNRGPGDSTFLAISAPATAADRSDVDCALVAPPVTVRRLAVDEWNLARTFRLAALAADPAAFGGSHADVAALDEAAWRAELERDTWLVAFAGPVPVGVTVFSPHDTYPDGAPQLGAMWVGPSWRRQGVATALEAAARAAARRNGAASIGLWVTAGNDDARAVYERLGYHASDATKPAPRDPRVPMFRMLRDVNPGPAIGVPSETRG
jgi:mannose-6-phosphate isomerase-like protein (cupin superfamily)/GNAT superfamily N-acetyltransferase